MFVAPSEMNTIKRDSILHGIIMLCSPSPEIMLPNTKVTQFEQVETHTSS